MRITRRRDESGVHADVFHIMYTFKFSNYECDAVYVEYERGVSNAGY